MTYSIVARDPISGDLGVAVASRFCAVGSLVPHIRHNAAMATQAFVNPMWGIEGIRRLSACESAHSVIFAGGDKRGRQAAALRIHSGQDYPVLDIRADDHADPLTELRRLYSVAQERALHFATTFATAENFSGTTDRTELDRSIAEREAQCTLDGMVSQSFATTL